MLFWTRWDPTTMVFQPINISATPLITFDISMNLAPNIVRSLLHRHTPRQISSRTLNQQRSMSTLANGPYCPVNSAFATRSPCPTTSTWSLLRIKLIWIRHRYWKKYSSFIEINQRKGTTYFSLFRRNFNSIKCSVRMRRTDRCSRVQFDRFSRWVNVRI